MFSSFICNKCQSGERVLQFITKEYLYLSMYLLYDDNFLPLPIPEFFTYQKSISVRLNHFLGWYWYCLKLFKLDDVINICICIRRCSLYFIFFYCVYYGLLLVSVVMLNWMENFLNDQTLTTFHLADNR